MSTHVDPKTVCEGAKYPDTAWGRIRAYLDNATAVLSRVDLGELLAENVQLKRKLEWPAEQPQDERDGDSAAETVRRFADVWAEYDNRRDASNVIRPASFLVVGNRGDTAQLTEPELRSVLDTRDQWRNLALSRGRERDGDVRAVAALLKLGDTSFRGNWLTDYDDARSELESRFADRIAALKARDAKGGEQR